MANIYDKLTSTRRPRVHIKYEIESGDSPIEKELPFVVGVMGDFSGNPEKPLRPLKERKFVQIDKENFNSVMERIAPELNFAVKDTLSGKPDSEMKIKMNFHSMDDFEPGRIAENVPALKKLLDSRNQLRDLMTKVDRSADLESLLEGVLQNEGDLKTLSGELGAGDGKESK